MIIVAATGVLSLLIGGCASERNWSEVGQPEDYQYVQTREGVSVAVEPWTKPDDLRTICRKDPGKDILAMRLVIFNRGDRCVRFSSTQTRVRLSNGEELLPLAVSEVGKRLEANESALAAIIVIGTGGYGGFIASAVSQATAEENWKSQRAARSCSMDLAMIDPGKALTGFLFYKCPPSRKSWRNDVPSVRFKILRMPRSTATPLEFVLDVPLKE